MRIIDWSSDVCSSVLRGGGAAGTPCASFRIFSDRAISGCAPALSFRHAFVIVRADGGVAAGWRAVATVGCVRRAALYRSTGAGRGFRRYVISEEEPVELQSLMSKASQAFTSKKKIKNNTI